MDELLGRARKIRMNLNSIEPPRYGAACPVVWEGRSRGAPPDPDLCSEWRSHRSEKANVCRSTRMAE